jgi:hypothetical protein
VIPQEEIAALLHGIANGRIEAHFVSDECGGVSATMVSANGWRIIFFDDASYLDWVSFAEAPDKRTAEYGDWGVSDPLDLVTDSERQALQDKFEAERGW